MSSNKAESLWSAELVRPSYPQQELPDQVEVCVVGAGIAGTSTAYELQRRGHQVALIEAASYPSGDSFRTSGHLSFALDDGFFNLEKLFGTEGSRLAAESHKAAIDFIERNIGEEAIECHFERVPGYLLLSDDKDRDYLEKELEAAKRAGLHEVELVDASAPCLLFPNQAQFQPALYIQALHYAVIRRGGILAFNSRVTNIRSQKTLQLELEDGGTIQCERIVVATNIPINDRFSMHTKQAPYRTYVVAAPIPKGSVAKALYWDTADPYHYVRLHPKDENTDYLIVGGADHKTGQETDEQKRFDLLEAWAKEKFPLVDGVEYRWSGQVMEPADSLGFIGKNPGDKDIYIVTGDSGHGLTHASLGAILISDLIEGKANAWSKIYDPSRKPTKVTALKDFARENFNVARQYMDWLKPYSREINEIQPGVGKIIQEGAKKLAVFRDESGHLHFRSAVCTHLGCIVQWNTADNCWDCPCHGSQFEPQGEVRHGPAKEALHEIFSESRKKA